MKKEELYLKSKEVETPSYIFDFDQLKQRVAYIQQAVGEEVTLCYAMKANPFLVTPLLDCVPRFEVCSPGEFAICERANIPMERIVLSGVYKEEKEVDRVISTYQGKGIYTVESLEHLRILDNASKKLGKSIKVLLRLTCGNQFGMDEAIIRALVKEWDSYPNLELEGIQYYSGTQKQGKTMAKELEFLDEFCMSLQKEYGVIIKELEYGPGLTIHYFKEQDDALDKESFDTLRQAVKNLQFGGRVTFEMGRFMAATCGYYLTKLVDYKVNAGSHYAIVDGGINHLNYYGQIMGMKKPLIWHFKEDEQIKEIQNVNICGSLCTSSDVIVKQYPLENPRIGDTLVFQLVGAYSITEGIYLFLSRDLPTVYAYEESKGIYCLRDKMSTHRINYNQ